MTNLYSSDYPAIGSQVSALLAGEPDPLANTCNLVGLLFNALEGINWLGVYVLREDVLVLGPFQGNPACVRIALGSGVCGTAVAERRTLRIADVHTFAGHIVCDPESRSEIVVPLISRDRVLGVLDIDSPHLDRFTDADQRGLEMLCRNFVGVLESNGMRTPAFI